MATQQGIKRRIRSVKNTRQITKAMQLVAASKLRRAQLAAVGPQAYMQTARGILESLSATPEAALNPLFISRPINNALTILVAGDRSLAGAYNSNIFKAFKAHRQELGVPQSAICIGRYAARHVARMNDISEKAAYTMESQDSDIEIAQPVLKEAVDAFISGEVDAVHIVYTKFVSIIRQEVKTIQLLPIASNATGLSGRTLEPSTEEVIALAADRLLEAQVLQTVLDGRASFFASQMLAMKNATDNAGDLIDDLTLALNNARQAAITQELAEISAGTEAMTE